MKGIFQFLGLMAVLLASPRAALANPEPTPYDARSIALGLTGVSYLETPAAVAINPANLEGIDKFSVSVLINPLFIDQSAPVGGPNVESQKADVNVAPTGAVFIAGRVSPRVVMGGGLYLEVGYGSKFKDVINVDGRAGNLLQGEDLSVTFAVGEFALATSYKFSDKLWLGAALRIPFSVQKSKLFVPDPLAISADPNRYVRVDQDFKGVGIPGGRFGLTYHASKHLTIGVMYRTIARIPLKGNADTIDPASPLSPLNAKATAESEWRLPHAIQIGTAIRLLEEKLMLVLGYRVQFHKQTNKRQLIISDAVTVTGITRTDFPLEVPFLWKNVHLGKIGIEYSPLDWLSARVGASLGPSATTPEAIQYFAPPSGFNGLISAGAGFAFKHFNIDLATAAAWGADRVEEDSQFCDPAAGKAILSGCQGEYTVFTWWTALTFTYHR